jgi:hypothetical protein
MTPPTPPARLLAQETREGRDSAGEPRPRVVTRHALEQDGTALRQRGLPTTSAGGFFCLPSLLPLGAYDLAAAWGAAKHEGIPKERRALGLVFESLFGYTAGRRAVDTVRRADVGLRAGRPFLPSPSTQSRFLQDVPVKSALACQTVRGRRLVALAHVTPGHPVNIDAHTVQTDSRKAMQHACITPEARDGKALRTFYPQAQASTKPRMALAASSGTPGSPGTHRVAELRRAILGRDFLRVAAKEGDGGPLIQARHAPDGGAVLPPVRSSPQRLGECDAVPLAPYDQTVWGHGAAVSTTMTACDGPLRMLLKQRRDGKDCALRPPGPGPRTPPGRPPRNGGALSTALQRTRAWEGTLSQP